MRERCASPRAVRVGNSRQDSTVGFAREPPPVTMAALTFASALAQTSAHCYERTRVHVQTAGLISTAALARVSLQSDRAWAARAPSLRRAVRDSTRPSLLSVSRLCDRGCSRSCSMPRDLACGLLLRCSRPSGARATVRAFAEGDLAGDPPRHTFRSRSGSCGFAAASASRG